MADLGCIPSDDTIIRQITKRIGPQDGLIWLNNEYGEGSGVRIIGKGVVTKWPQHFTATYDTEHAEAVKLAGKKVDKWPDISYKPLQAS